MNTLRKLSLCTLVALALLVVSTLSAQEETFGLTDSDWTLLTTASATAAAAESLTFEFTTDVSVAGMGDDVNVTLEGSGVIGGTMESPLFGMVVNGQIEASGETTPADFEVRLVGDTAFFNAGTGWQGGKVEDLMAAFSQGFMQGFAGSSGLPIDPDAIASGDLSGLAGMEGFSDAMMALASLNPSDFIDAERLDDEDGQAHFQWDLSVSDLLQTPAMGSMLAMSMAGSTPGVEIPEEQLAAMGQMMAMMFSDTTITFDQWIDPVSSVMTRALLDINFPIPDMSGTGSSAGSVLLNFDISLSGFNEPVTVEVPEGATMLPSAGS